MSERGSDTRGGSARSWLPYALILAGLTAGMALAVVAPASKVQAPLRAALGLPVEGTQVAVTVPPLPYTPPQPVRTVPPPPVPPQARPAHVPRPAPPPPPPAPVCTLPAPAGDARVVAVGIGTGQAISRTAVGSFDVTTELVTVEIVAGVEPLYLVMLSSKPMLWQFTGATERVVHAALMQPRTGGGTSLLVGASGLPAVTVSFHAAQDCLAGQGGGLKAQLPSLRVALPGLAAEDIFVQNEVSRLTLPSGTVTALSRSDAISRTGNPDTARWPAGTVTVDPAQVVSAQSAAIYDVLPGAYGLEQLVKEGKLVRLADGYRIAQPIPRLPAELPFSPYRNFLLAPGVPLPPAGVTHDMCIVAEDSGQPVSGACR